MSVQQTKNNIEDEAYQVVEATNEDGTIDGKIVQKPVRDGDTLKLKIRPLAPGEDTVDIHLDWPDKNTDQYQAVRLCQEKVGGFQAVGQLENEKVRLQKSEGNWVIDIPDAESDSNLFESTKKAFYISSIAAFFISLIGTVAPFIMVLLYPFDISLLTFSQSVSIMFASLIMMFITGAIIAHLEHEQEERNQQTEQG